MPKTVEPCMLSSERLELFFKRSRIRAEIGSTPHSRPDSHLA